MRPINLKVIKRDNFSKIIEEGWTSHNSFDYWSNVIKRKY